MAAEESFTPTLVQTKLYRPAASDDLIPRPRLMERLNDGLGRTLTLVSAPAGFGKTTTVAQWLNQLPIKNEPSTLQRSQFKTEPGSAMNHFHIAWLSLEIGDNDPARFLTYLTAALAGVTPGLEEGIKAVLSAPQLPPPEAIAGRLVNDIAAIDRPLLLVLDDYHHISARAIHKMLAFLLEHRPQPMHLVIITREDPSIPLARLRGQGEITDIRQGDLRFTVEETAAFLNEMMGLNLSPDDIAALETRTEGWIAGLQLAALSMRDRDDVGQFIHSFTGSNRYIMEYLIEEVFLRQNEAMQSYLLQTSILDRLCGPLCDAVVGGQGEEETFPHPSVTVPPGPRSPSQAILESLERSNLFLIPLDDGRRWYRYHHLFADLLRHRLVREGPPMGELHGRASQWYEANGFIAEAIQHALAAKDWQRAGDLVEEAREKMLKQGQITTLLRWIEALPFETIQSRPQLCFSAAWALALSGQLGNAERFLVPVEQFVDRHPRLIVELLILQAHIARARHDVPRTIALSEKAFSFLPPDDANARCILGVNLGAAYLYSGDLTRAAEIWAEATRNGQRSGNYHATALSLSFTGQVRMARGKLHQAADLHRQAIGLGGQKEPLPATARAYVNLAALAYEWHDLDSAGQNCRQALQLSRLSGDVHMQRDAQRVLALVCQAQGDTGGALAAARQAYALIKEGETPVNGTLATAMTQVRVSLAQGDVAQAERWVERIEALVPESDLVRLDLLANAGCPSAGLGLARARLLLAQGRKGEAESLAEACFQAAAGLELVYTQVEARLLGALATPDQAAAGGYLAEALTLAQAEGYIRTFVDEGEAAQRLLRQAFKLGIKPQYTKTILAAFGPGREEGTDLPEPRPELVEPLREREMEILALLAQGQTNAEIAQTLFISLNTVKTHLRHIYEKLDVHDRRAAVARGRETGILH